MREYDRRINAANGSIAVAARKLLSEVDNYSNSSLDVNDIEKRGDMKEGS